MRIIQKLEYHNKIIESRKNIYINDNLGKTEFSLFHFSFCVGFANNNILIYSDQVTS